MPTIVNVRVAIYESRIQAHFTPAGEVGQNAGAVGRSAVVLARGFVNNRTGALSAGINAGHQPGGGLYYNLFLNGLAPHTKWVEHGTGDIVLAPGQWRALKPYPAGGYPRTTVVGSPKSPRHLSGQTGQHILARGMAAGLSAHGYPVSSEVFRGDAPVTSRI